MDVRTKLKAKMTYYIWICGVMVIVVGNGHDDTSSKPGRD